MSVPATLHIQDTPELKIAKNFLILGILVNALVYPFFLLPVVSLILSIMSFGFTTAGLYKLSKLARNQVLFKYYTFSVIDGILIVVIMSAMNLKQMPLSPNFWFFTGILAVIVCGGFYFYFFYKICLELGKITTLGFFVLAFKGMAAGIIIFLFACLFFSMKEVFYFLTMLSLVAFLMSGIVFIVGIFSIKKVVCEAY
ncbi:hypothetical protein [Helicobacter cappadocius]|uniref:Uncharacterized protein n=1 Tax=Helicobacter cappadocius TaxID=3063998 RepID=A0AA90PQJ0_9HELI|nr:MULTISPECIES: hypothetical protein [unclassified Helicobacter]MDO7252902.1 hypothetical protein [Helicobacter sp. faydin-H75]MDP2538946.1 hypothetical protein [Helicobacter sp. faydin-H76]